VAKTAYSCCKVHENVVQKFKVKCQEMTGEPRMSSCRQKEETDGADCSHCTSSGRMFQKMEAATGNERRPAVDRRYGRMYSCSVNDDPQTTTWQARDTRTVKPSSHSFSTGLTCLIGYRDARLLHCPFMVHTKRPGVT